GDQTAAEQALTEAEQIDPEARTLFRRRESAFVKRGNRDLKEKRFDRAKTEFEGAIVVNEKSVAGHIGLGESLQALGDQEGTNEAFERALEIDERPENLHVYNRIGIVARHQKNFEMASRALDRALSFDAEDPVLYFYKSTVHISQKQFKEALALLDKALELKPEFPEAQKARAAVAKYLKPAAE
ncbi:MAG: tetratricopeptide repeat protein, partial [bacterium]